MGHADRENVVPKCEVPKNMIAMATKVIAVSVVARNVTLAAIASTENMALACEDMALVVTAPASVVPKHAALAVRCVHPWGTSPAMVRDGHRCVRRSIVHAWRAADRRTVAIRGRDIKKAINTTDAILTAARSSAVTKGAHRSHATPANIAAAHNATMDITAGLVPTSDTMHRVARRAAMDVHTTATAVTNGCIITHRTVDTNLTSVTHHTSTMAMVIAARHTSRGAIIMSLIALDIIVRRKSIAITMGMTIAAMSVICGQNGRRKLDS
jgi:hypothetical protein